MQWNNHFEIADDEHAVLSGSNYHWTNYDDEKMIRTYKNGQAKEIGTELHDWAAIAIKLNRKQPRNQTWRGLTDPQLLFWPCCRMP